MMACAPSSRALATATTMPRSLKDPVGCWPSTLRYSSGTPMARPRLAGVHERREALAQAERRRGGADGQELREALHESRATALDGLLALQLLEHLAHAHGVRRRRRTG